MSCIVYSPRQHYKQSMRIGRVFPTNKAQAAYFVSRSQSLDVLNSYDVNTVEAFLNKHGFEGNYRYTKSGNWVRLENNNVLLAALKLEYSL